MYPCLKPTEYRISEKVNIPYLREKLLPRSAHAMFCIPSEPFSADVRSDARLGSKTSTSFFTSHLHLLNQIKAIQTKCLL